MRTWISDGLVRTSRSRGALLSACAFVAGGALLARSAAGEGQAGAPSGPTKYEATPALYVAGELGQGGLPLYQALFPSGWPTTKDYRKATLEAGGGAFCDNVGAILGSGLGVPLTVSDGERARLKDLQTGDKAPGTVSAMLRDRLEKFRKNSGLATPLDDKFMPVFLPFRRGEPVVAGYEDARPGTWAWSSKATESNVSLDAVGLSIFANTLIAEQQLTVSRTVDKGSGADSFVGKSDVEGFVGFCALNCAVDAMNELRTKLCINMKTPEHPVLDPFPKAYTADGEYGRRTYYPHLVTPKLQAASVQYDVGASEEAKKSYLWDQAALLLGVCELARISENPKTSIGRYFSSGEKDVGFFDPETSSKATELAIFIFQSMYALNVNSQGKPSSVATIQDFGTVLFTQDAGLFLLALESFLQLPPKSEAIKAAQNKARNRIDTVAKFLVTVQKNSKVAPGFCDAFNIDNESPTNSNASLAAQGLAIRGLLAAKRAYALPGWNGAGTRPDVLNAAQRTVDYLEKSRWDGDRKAYLDAPGTKGPQKLTAFDAFAILGGLRDLALDQKDVRYLLRYKAYLATIRANGVQLSGSAREGDGTDGVKKTAVVGLAPVTVTEISLP